MPLLQSHNFTLHGFFGTRILTRGVLALDTLDLRLEHLHTLRRAHLGEEERGNRQIRMMSTRHIIAMPKLCGTDSFYGGGMVTGQPIGTMIGSRMINNAQAGFIIGAVIMGFRIRGA